MYCLCFACCCREAPWQGWPWGLVNNIVAGGYCRRFPEFSRYRSADLYGRRFPAADTDFLDHGQPRWRDHVSLEIYPGEVLALLGPNGAGKSSILKLLSDEVACDSGRVVFSGRKELALWLKIGVLAILHDLNLAALHANRIALLKHGKLSGAGLPQEILTSARIQQVFDTKASVMAHPHRPQKTLIVTG